MLTEIEGIPERLLDTPATGLVQVLDGPTLIHIAGQKPEPVFASVLLHGNEVTGWEAVQELLCRYRENPLPRALSLFVGNVRAAAKGLRSLDSQVDYNRVWPSADGVVRSGPEGAMLGEVVARMKDRNVMLSVDIHNNTGRNPHYACVTRLSPQTLQLATRFAPKILYFTRPEGVQSMAFDEICPAVTIECGAVGSANSRLAAMAYLERCLALDLCAADRTASWPETDSYSLYRSAATVKIPADTSFGFGENMVEVSFPADLDERNWRDLPAGYPFATLDAVGECPLQVTDVDGNDVAASYFDVIDGQLRTTRPLTPAMLTTDSRVIRQDCLCYLLERQPLPIGR